MSQEFLSQRKQPMRKYLYITVFFSGMTCLAIEMSAERLLGNVFGTSNLVWASIIGLILIYLAVGYFLGGYLADRKPSPRWFFLILLLAAISIALIPPISKPVLRMASEAFDQLAFGILIGSFITVLILLLVPMILLGTASPFAIRLAVDETTKVGSISGKIYAISTLGSFIGTFLPGLILIPLIGTYRTILAFSFLLLMVSLIGLWISLGNKATLRFLWTPPLILIIALWGVAGPYKITKNKIFETESAYNYIQVLEENGYRMLRLNDGQGVHSVYHPTVLNYYGPWEQVLVAPFFNRAPYQLSNVKSLAIIGLAAGTTARQATAVYGDIRIDGYEIDPEIVQVGRRYFDMTQPNLNILVQDGRWGIAHSQEKYHIISVDAYRPPYIPWHLTTREFFTIIHQHLTPDGVMVINVGRSPTDRRLIDALGSTILSVFPTIHVIDIPNTFNSIIFATLQPTETKNLIENYHWVSKDVSIPPLLIETMQVAIANIQPAPQPQKVFTDDWAPVEWITNTMILDFVFSGNMEGLQ